jgi:NADH-quinone oxidoreductase subunit G
MMRAAHPVFGDINHVTPAPWGAFGEPGRVSSEPFVYPIADFYRTDPISRASPTMAECSALFRGDPESQPRTGTHG